MDTVNKKYNIEITVLSPLNIGAGAEKDWVKGVDFVVKDSKIYLLNLKKMVQNGIDPQELTTFFANKDDAGLLMKFGNKLDCISDRIVDLPANSDNDIKSFIKNELTNKPIIPGSSLKGAVRSVILEYLLQGQKPQSLNEKDYFGDSNKGDELMRFIKFSDAEFEETALVNTKIFNLRKPDVDWLGGWKFSGSKTNEKYQSTGFNTLYEAILQNKTGTCSIMISDSGLFNAIEKQTTNILKSKIEEDKKKFKEIELKKDTKALIIKEDDLLKKERLFSINELFSVINGHTKKYIDKEISFFKKYATDKTKDIVESLEQIKMRIPEDNSACILKMSAGSGAHSITGDIWHKDYSVSTHFIKGKKVFEQAPKSRKIAINDGSFSLMGFVKLTIVSDEEMQKRRNAINEEREKAEKTRLEELAKIKAEQEQKAKEEAERQKKSEEERLKKEAEGKAEQERLAAMTPDDREKEKFQNSPDYGNLINASLSNAELTVDFFKWLKQFLIEKKQWKINGDEKKDKSIKRCQNIETKISNL
jgi:CRISPR/Cas system CSM-associated protein Csm5 (group 7 of RAMP superfamily)